MSYPRTYGSWQRELATGIGSLLVLALLPYVVTDSYWRHVLIISFIFAVTCASWDLTLGYGGIFNFGHLAFFGIGLYSYGILTTGFAWSPWLAFGAAGLMSAFIAIIVTIPILRLKGIYVVLVTFGFSQLVMQLIVSQPQLTGGPQGMIRLPNLPWWDHNFVRDGRFGHYYLAVVLLAVSIVALRVFVRSRSGMALVALRDSEEYAISRGISLAKQRFLALTVSAMIAGFAGAFYGSYLRTASVEVFSMGFTSLILSAILLGGAGSVYGPVVAAFFLTVASEFLTTTGALRPMIIAAVIVAVMLVYPGGLAAAVGSVGRWRKRASDKPVASAK